MIQDFKNSALATLSNMMIYSSLLYFVSFILISCSQETDLYKSVCDKDKVYDKVDMADLLKNINSYNGKYVELEGKYKSGFEESALYGKSYFEEDEVKSALWVNFDDFMTRCPLISSKTKLDLFSGEKVYRKMANKTVVLHGIIDVNQKGHLSRYSASLKDITLVVIKR